MQPGYPDQNESKKNEFIVPVLFSGSLCRAQIQATGKYSHNLETRALLLPDEVIPANILEWHQPPEFPSGLKDLQCLLKGSYHRKMGLMKRQPVDLYGTPRAGLLTEVTSVTMYI